MAPTAPKKAAAPKAKTTKAAAPKHAPFSDMIKDAILNLKDRNGSSRQAIKKYITANNNLGGLTEAAFNKHISRALETGDGKTFEFPKGKSGPVKLKKPGTAKPAEKADKPKVEKKKTATKAKSTTKTAPAKKAAATKKTTAKKAAPKTKANASKPRKTAPAAPAVEDKPPVVLGKTKSGRVTKTKAPQAAKAAKKAAPKKTAAKKAAPKKAAPKKEAKAEA